MALWYLGSSWTVRLLGCFSSLLATGKGVFEMWMEFTVGLVVESGGARRWWCSSCQQRVLLVLFLTVGFPVVLSKSTFGLVCWVFLASCGADLVVLSNCLELLVCGCGGGGGLYGGRLLGVIY